MTVSSRLLFSLAFLATTPISGLTPARLRVELRENPLGIDAPKPRLGWGLESSEKAQSQTAYEIQVSSTRDGQGDLWATGKLRSNRTLQIEYSGKPLASHQQVYWKVRVWDGADRPSPWSPVSTWSMGVLKPEDWKAQWIAWPQSPSIGGPLPLFRKDFTVKPGLKRAVAYVSGLGHYELFLNGKKVDDRVLDPGWTNYRKTVLYSTFDVTSLLNEGRNAAGAMLGNGFYHVPGGRYTKFTASFGPPVFLLHLRLEYSNGTVEVVATDGSWKAAAGPITFSCIYGGEDYDARREIPGWMNPGFDGSKWDRVFVSGAAGGDLVSQSIYPIKVAQTFKTTRITQPAPGIRIYDLGQNFAGWPHIKARGPAGATVTMTTGELLLPNGRVDQTSATGSSRGPRIQFRYTLKGQGVEEWHPQFTYTGFRYVEVEGDAEVIDMQGDFIHSSTPRAGEFTSSSPLFDHINELVDFAVRSNMQSVLTDCPHREKLGWLEVSHLMAPSLLYTYDAAALLEKIARDTRESQLDSGLVPDIAPEYTFFVSGFRDSPEWGSAAVLLPSLLYHWTGDTKTLAASYETSKRYVSYLGQSARDNIVSQGLGDWYDIGPGGPGESKLTPRGVTATAFYYLDLLRVAEAASLLGHPSDQAKFTRMAREVNQSFQTKFWDAAKRYYGSGSQTAQALPLVAALVPAEYRTGALDQLVKDIRQRGNQQTAGDIGYRFLIRALTDAGRSDVLYDINSRTDPPSYGHQISQGVTSLAEAWDANPHSSQNHCMLGHIQEWFYAGLAGINPAPDAVAFDKIIIRPQPAGDLTKVSAHYDSIRGRIATAWTIDGDTFRLRVSIPPNTTARIIVPGKSPNPHPLEQSKCSTTFAIPSGDYEFTATNSRECQE